MMIYFIAAPLLDMGVSEWEELGVRLARCFTRTADFSFP